jgi:hypothetical protein
MAQALSGAWAKHFPVEGPHSQTSADHRCSTGSGGLAAANPASGGAGEGPQTRSLSDQMTPSGNCQLLRCLVKKATHRGHASSAASFR